MEPQGSDEGRIAWATMLGNGCDENVKEARRMGGRQIRESEKRGMTIRLRRRTKLWFLTG